METQTKIVTACAVICVMLCLFLPINSYSQQQFEAKNKGRLHDDIIGKYLKNYSVYEIDTKAIGAFVKSHFADASFELVLANTAFHLNMEMNDLRSEDFKAVAMNGNETTTLPQTIEATYKGYANDDRKNIVRLAIDETTFEGYIQSSQKYLYLDMLKHYIPGDKSNAVVVYVADDVIPDLNKTCGSEKLKEAAGKYHQNLKPTTGNCHFLEIATEADYEYYQAFGNDASKALSRIRNIMNLVEGVYTSPFDVKFIIRYQQIWTTNTDPYTGDTLQGILPQFTNWWNANRTNITRDETHLFSGRTLSNSTVGYAWIGVVCNASVYYSTVGNYSPVTNATVNLSAHEIGHNFGAGHDSTCNGNNIMCPNIQNGIPQWSSQSINEINNYIANNGSCMTENFPANQTIFGLNATFGYVKTIATNSISLNSAIAPFTFSNTNGFGYIEAGSYISLIPTNPNSTGFYAPEGSTVVMRISDVSTTCDQLFVQRPFAKYSQQVQVPELSTNNVVVYPNPFSRYFIVSFNNAANETFVQLNIYNAQGLRIKTEKRSLLKGVNKLSVYGGDLPAGYYLVELIRRNEKSTGRVVKL